MYKQIPKRLKIKMIQYVKASVT